jgi:hypothetical protein
MSHRAFQHSAAISSSSPAAASSRPLPPLVVSNRRRVALLLFVIFMCATVLSSTLVARHSYDAPQQLATTLDEQDAFSHRRHLASVLTPFGINHTQPQSHPLSLAGKADEDGACLTDATLPPRLRRGVSELRHAAAVASQLKCRRNRNNATPQLSLLRSVTAQRGRGVSPCRPPPGYGVGAAVGRELSSTAGGAPHMRLLPNQSYAKEFSQFVKNIPLAKETTIFLSQRGEKKDCVLYTVVVGNKISTLQPFVHQTVDCHWVAFTDNMNLAGAERWLLQPIPSHLLSDERNFMSKQFRGYSITKFIKMLPFLLFPASITFAVYVDAMHNVSSSNFTAQAINVVKSANAPIALMRHTNDNATSITAELERASNTHRENAVALHLLVKQVLAHIAEGLCDNWFNMKDEEALSPPSPVAEQLALHQLSRVLRRAFCSQTPEAVGLSTTMGRRFLLHRGKLRHPCRHHPHANSSALPHLSEGLLHAMPVATSEGDGTVTSSRVVVYDTSVIAFRLNHPHTPTRKFAEEFLKQWYRDSSLHGEDQLPLVMLLWRTPGYVPALLANTIRSGADAAMS